ncbi:MAG: hypothetical protein M1814_004084 [Vezdaea aestivalis]|nr:MAG: hypothetical protein M1814_004084 [Vezdaea aestivalis]
MQLRGNRRRAAAEATTSTTKDISNGTNIIASDTTATRPAKLAAVSAIKMEIDTQDGLKKRKRDIAASMAKSPPPDDSPNTASPTSATPSIGSNMTEDNPNKKIKVESQKETHDATKMKVDTDACSISSCLDRSSLPSQMWLYIFSYLPPRVLAKTLLANKRFNLLITGQSEDIESTYIPAFQNNFPAYNSNQIWFEVRKRYFSDLPKPLVQVSELQMIQLTLGTKCQFCGKAPATSLPIYDLTSSGPGDDGVRIIWPFASRMCGQCLLQKTSRDFDLLMSSATPNHLLRALPFIFVTAEKNVIMPHVLEDLKRLTQTPDKRYFKSQVEAICREFEDVKAFGGAAAEEWAKGLDLKGTEIQKDALRLEKWEARAGLHNIRQTVPLDSIPVAPSASVIQSDQNWNIGNGPFAQAQVAVPGLPKRVSSIPAFPPGLTAGPAPQRPPFFPPHHGSYTLPPPPVNSQPPKVERSLEEVTQAKAQRRLEIEKRCAAFDPPILPNVLAQMDSFQAAIQISTPLTDSAWEVLKPRLISQREIAEKREQERIATEQAAQQRLEERKQQEYQMKEARENQERDWDEKQGPIRQTLGSYADEAIEQRWADPGAVTKDNCPNFAADVLLYVRQKFYDNVAKEDKAARAVGQEPRRDSPTGPPTRKLVLENMKWVYDTKVKSRTENFRKELFLCHDCKENPKYYGFEGVIQHFAAKHTNALSVGPVVVHWRAEWPERSPFHPDPAAAKSLTIAAAQHAYAAPSGYGYNQYNAHLNGSAHQVHNQGIYSQHQQPPDVYASQRGFHNHPGPDMYGSHPGNYGQNGPRGYPNPSRAYPPGPSMYDAGRNAYPGYNNQPYAGPTPPLAGNNYNQPFQGHDGAPGPQGNYRGSYPHNGPPGPPQTMYPVPPDQGGSHAGQEPGHEGAPFNKKHIEDMAISAREIWSRTANIKGLPISVRIFVLIYHVRTKFQCRHNYTLSLAMFTDGMENHHIMKAIKQNPGTFACRTCQIDSRSAAHYSSNPLSARGHSLIGLLKHFQSVHVERYVYPYPDWTQDMIDLPEESVVSGLVEAPGMDDHKLKLIAQAFPSSFQHPLPKVGIVASPNLSMPSESEYGAVAAANLHGSSLNRPGSQGNYGQAQIDSNGNASRNSLDPAHAYGFGVSHEPQASKPEALEGYGYRPTAEIDSTQSRTIAGPPYPIDGQSQILGAQGPHSFATEPTLDRVKTEQQENGDRRDREPSYDPRESGLVFAPSKTMADPGASLTPGRPARDPVYGAEDGSEDGEVGSIMGGPRSVRKVDHHLERQREADQFLRSMDIDNGDHQAYVVPPRSNSRRGRKDPVQVWSVEEEDPRASRLATDAFDNRTQEDAPASSEGTYRPMSSHRDAAWNTDGSAILTSRDYNQEARYSRPPQTTTQERRYIQYAEAQPSRSQSGRYYEDRAAHGAVVIEREAGRRYEPANYEAYTSTRQVPAAYDEEGHQRGERSAHRPPFEQPYHTREPERQGDGPDDLRSFLRVPGAKEERAYAEEPRRPTYRAQYLVAQPAEERRSSHYITVPAGYSQYDDGHGPPIYVERQPAYSTSARAYERGEQAYRHVRYG